MNWREYFYAWFILLLRNQPLYYTLLIHINTLSKSYLSLRSQLSSFSRELMPVSQIAFYDVGLDEFREEVPETSADSQRVVYEDPVVELRLLCGIEDPLSSDFVIKTAENITPDCKSGTVIFSTAARVIPMEGISKYSGTGGGLSQRQFKQDAKTVYNKMLQDPQEHLMFGFGQWEFITLIGSRLSGEARTVHAFFLEKWDFEDEDNPMLIEAEDVERRRQLWRMYKRENAAYLTLRANSGFPAPPQGPNESEPRDLERFFSDLEARFRSSLIENLAAIQNFAPIPNETSERMFARFNVLAIPLEEERPRVMTREQLKTTNQVHLKSLLSHADSYAIVRH